MTAVGGSHGNPHPAARVCCRAWQRGGVAARGPWAQQPAMPVVGVLSATMVVKMREYPVTDWGIG